MYSPGCLYSKTAPADRPQLSHGISAERHIKPRQPLVEVDDVTGRLTALYQGPPRNPSTHGMGYRHAICKRCLWDAEIARNCLRLHHLGHVNHTTEWPVQGSRIRETCCSNNPQPAIPTPLQALRRLPSGDAFSCTPVRLGNVVLQIVIPNPPQAPVILPG